MNGRMGPFPSTSKSNPVVSPSKRVPPELDDTRTLQSALHTRTKSRQSAASVSPVSPSELEMIDYLSLQTSCVSSDPVDFYLVLAKQLTKKKDFTRAFEYYSRALRILNKVAANSKKEQLKMSDVLFCIGRIHLELRDLPKALLVFDICYNIRRQLLDWDDERNAIVLQQQAYIYSSMGDSESTVQVLEELLGILCCVEYDIKILRETWLELARHQEILGLETEASSSREEASQLQ